MLMRLKFGLHCAGVQFQTWNFKHEIEEFWVQKVINVINATRSPFLIYVLKFKKNKERSKQNRSESMALSPLCPENIISNWMDIRKDLDSKYKIDGSDITLGIMLAFVLVLLFSLSTSV